MSNNRVCRAARELLERLLELAVVELPAAPDPRLEAALARDYRDALAVADRLTSELLGGDETPSDRRAFADRLQLAALVQRRAAGVAARLSRHERDGGLAPNSAG